MRTQIVAAALVATSALTSCTSDKESAEDVADELAAALSSEGLSEGPFEGEPPQSAYEGIVAGLGDVAPAVEISEVTEEEGAADAVLSWRWDLGGTVWEYESTAELTEAETGW